MARRSPKSLSRYCRTRGTSPAFGPPGWPSTSGANSPVLVVVERRLQRIIRRLRREAEGLAPRAPNALRVLGLHAPVTSLAARQQAGAGQRVLRLALVRRLRDQLVEVRRERPPPVWPVGENEVVVGEIEVGRYKTTEDGQAMGRSLHL